jgi:hypothetical protein
VNEYGQRRPGLFLKEKSANQHTARGHRGHNALERKYLGARDADVYHGLRANEVNYAKGYIALRPLIEPIDADFPLTEVECWYYPHLAEAEFGSTPEHEDPPPERCRGRCDLMGLAPKGMVAVGPGGGPMDIGGLPIIADHKTGAPMYQTPALKSKQLRFFANWLYVMRRDLCMKGVAVGVYLTQSGSFQPYWLTPADLRQFQEDLAGLWGLFDLVDLGDAKACGTPMSCKSATSKWCSVAGCMRSVQ